MPKRTAMPNSRPAAGDYPANRPAGSDGSASSQGPTAPVFTATPDAAPDGTATSGASTDDTDLPLLLSGAELKKKGLILKNHFWDEDDITEFIACGSQVKDESAVQPAETELTRPAASLAHHLPYDDTSLQGAIYIPEKNSANERVIGRYQLCSCYGMQYWSMTGRITDKRSLEEHGERKTYLPVKADAPNTPYVEAGGSTPSEKYPLPLRVTWELLYSLIFDEQDSHPHGIIVVSGSTGTGKSSIVRGLIYTYLEHLISGIRNSKAPKYPCGKGRRPHFLTVEDPIETLYYSNPFLAQEHGLDYTPREIGTDTKDITQVFQDALRQKPALVYVGEVRRPTDWEPIVDFAGTGHLVITTAHAGSLVEAMDRILKATSANSPVRRGQVAETLKAVIHLSNLEGSEAQAQASGTPKSPLQNITLPALWKNTSTSVASLVADGLASVLPGHDCRSGSVGRLYFADELARYSACFFDNKRSLNMKYFETGTFPKGNPNQLTSVLEAQRLGIAAILNAFAEEQNKLLNQWKQATETAAQSTRATTPSSKTSTRRAAAKIADPVLPEKPEDIAAKEAMQKAVRDKAEADRISAESAQKSWEELPNRMNALIWDLALTNTEWGDTENLLKNAPARLERLKQSRRVVNEAFACFLIQPTESQQEAGMIRSLPAMRKAAMKTDLQGK